MRNYAINNIMSHNDALYFIESIDEYAWIRNHETRSSVPSGELHDVELSDWFFNKLFEDKRSVDTWMIAGRCNILDRPIYWIKKETEWVYLFQRIIKGRTVYYSIDSVRAFQNLYNFYREYDEWAECLVDIDGRIKEIFKVV